jgi:hypothetical protein
MLTTRNKRAIYGDSYTRLLSVCQWNDTIKSRKKNV